jgi:Flp pilus assembly protein TadD
VDAAAARVIESCLAFDPKARPQNARSLAQALRRQLSPAGRARRWASLHVPLLIVLTSLALAATAVTTYVLVPKEPYSLRQLHQGRDNYRQGHYEDALQHLMRAVEADRPSADAYFARGRTFLRLGHYESALADFQTADELAGGQDGRIKACLGYCSNLLGIHEGAIFHYDEARELNFTTAEVLNNLGYSYTVWRNPLTKPDDALDRADEFLTQALKLDNRLQPAHYNRARVNSQRLPRQGLADIREAIKLGPVSAPLYWDAARLACLLATREGRQDPEIFDYLNAAIDNGLDPAKLKRDHIFETFAADNRFLAVLQKEPDPNPMKEAQKLVDPIQD